MNEIFSFHKELNIKKIIIVIIILLVLISLVLFKVFHITKKINEEKIEAQNPNSTFYDESSNISLTLSKDYGLVQYLPSDDKLLELRSENNLNIYLEKQDLIEGKSLYDVASADILAYTENFSSYSNLSELKEIDNSNFSAYTYSFHYLDSKNKTTYYLQTIWIQTDTNYYIASIEFPLDNLNDNINIINDVFNNLLIKENL
jgi:hypothetical protein